jgi:predicted TIM-barrel fold metal-dependent hydrolase
VYELISVDDHIIEPSELWVDRLPQKYREAGPHVIEQDGREYWVYEDRRQDMTMGLNAVVDKPPEEWSNEPLRFSDMAEGCYNPMIRAAAFRERGIVGSMNFPTLPRFGGALFLEFEDKELAHLCVKAWNDWMFDEWCAAVPDLYIPMAIAPIWDPELAAAEIYRCVDRGARSIAWLDNPANLGLPSYYTDHWDPVWNAFVETGVPASLHILSSTGAIIPSPEADLDVSIILSQTSAGIALMNLISSPTLRKFPELKIVLSEGGIGWIPGLLEKADRSWRRQNFDTRYGWTESATEIFRRNFWGAFFEDRVGVEQRHRIGVDRLLWECDYPHQDACWPDPQSVVAEILEGVPAEEVELITNANARELLNWPKEGHASTSGRAAAKAS